MYQCNYVADCEIYRFLNQQLYYIVNLAHIQLTILPIFLTILRKKIIFFILLFYELYFCFISFILN